MFRLIATLGLIFSVFIMPGAHAQGKSKTETAKETIKEKIFSREEASIISDVLGIGHDDEEEAYQDKKGKNKSKGKGKSKSKGKGRGDGLPPGLAKRSQLPPGLAKMKTLPPGLSKSRLPYDLESRLPPPPPGTDRFIIGGESVVLVDQSNGQVVDIIDGKVNKTRLEEVEKRTPERLRHKDRAADGDPDRPIVTGNVPAKEKEVKKEDDR